MFFQRLTPGILAIPLLAILWIDGRKPIIPPQTHIPPEENTDTWRRMIQELSCQEFGSGYVLYAIPNGVGIRIVCVPPALPVKI